MCVVRFWNIFFLPFSRFCFSIWIFWLLFNLNQNFKTHIYHHHHKYMFYLKTAGITICKFSSFDTSISMMQLELQHINTGLSLFAIHFRIRIFKSKRTTIRKKIENEKTLLLGFNPIYRYKKKNLFQTRLESKIKIYIRITKKR